MAFPRVAFLPDAFHEVNGVAHTSRQYEAFVRRRQLPFLSIHCGPVAETTSDGAVRIVQLKRGRASFGLDAKFDYDPFLLRYARQVQTEIKNFGADLIHVTGPGDMGTLGFLVARKLGLPLVISWHTSLHEYAARRFESLISFLGRKIRRRISSVVEKLGLRILVWFYRQAAVVLAPNPELVELVGKLTKRPVFLMRRGVDTRLFSPARRNRLSATFQIGYVGRLTAEKNVRMLADTAKTLQILGRQNFEVVIVGEGREEAWLRQHLPEAIFTGVLRGERLAETYANLDLFVFPSATDTFGNVVLEALASGVPAVVKDAGGPKFLVENGVNGFVATSDWEFASLINEVMTNTALHRTMRGEARRYACLQSWAAVFEDVYRSYEHCHQAPFQETSHGILNHLIR